MPHIVRGHHVFPLDAFGSLEAFAVRVFARLEVATAKVDVLLVVVSAPAVESLLQFSVIDASHLLTCIAVVVMPGGSRRVDACLGERREECDADKCEKSGSAHWLESVKHIGNKFCKDVDEIIVTIFGSCNQQVWNIWNRA